MSLAMDNMSTVPPLPAPPPASELAKYRREPASTDSPLKYDYPDSKRVDDYLDEHLGGITPEEHHEFCVKGLVMFPFSVEAYYCLGTVYAMYFNDVEKAATACEHARKCALILWPELQDMDQVSFDYEAFRPYLRSLNYLGLTRVKQGNYQQALEVLRYLRRVDPTNMQGHKYRKFTALIAQGHYEEAHDLSKDWSFGDERGGCDFCWITVLLEYILHQQGRCSKNVSTTTCFLPSSTTTLSPNS